MNFNVCKVLGAFVVSVVYYYFKLVYCDFKCKLSNDKNQQTILALRNTSRMFLRRFDD